jgi:hypothetical protein
MAEFSGFTPREAPELPSDPNSGGLTIAGTGSFGSLNVSGIVTSTGNSNGTNTLTFSVSGSDITFSVAGIGSTTLKLA